MATVEELQVLITANAANFEKQMQNVQRQIADIDKTSQTTRKSFLGVGTAASLFGNLLAQGVAAGFSAFSRAMDGAISRLDTLNNFPRVMGNLSISSAEATKAINYISEKLQGLPTSLDAASMAVQRFASVNGDLRGSTAAFLAVNNAILAGGAPTEIQAAALEQLAQSYAKGKPDMMEWRTMMSAMPAQLNQVAQAMNYASADQLGAALRSGEISMTDFLNTMVRLNKEGAPGFLSFEQQARNSTNGVATSIANLKTAIVRGLANIMDAIGQANIVGFFNAIANAVNAVVPYITAFVKLVMTGISALGALFGGETKEISGNAKSMGDSLSGAGAAAGGLADNAGAAGGNLGKAAKEAKKLKKIPKPKKLRK